MSSPNSLLPDYVGIVQATSLNFYNTSTNLLNTLGSYLAEINENIKFNRSLVTTNVLSSYTVLYNELNKTDFTVSDYQLVDGKIIPSGTKQLDNQFINYFIEKYLSLSESYRTTISKNITNNSFFAPFSDDIGFTIETSTILDDNTVPYFDIYTQNYFYPINIPTTLLNKVSLNEKTILKMFSFYGDPLLRNNLVGLQTGNLNANTAQTSHGTNLINDVLYYKRAVANHHDFMVAMQVTLNVISDFILFFEGLNPRDQDPERTAVFYKYNITNMEGYNGINALNYSGIGVTTSLLRGSLSAAQTTNLAANGVVQFNKIDSTTSADISLNTTTGVITLIGNKTYRLVGVIPTWTSSTAQPSFSWYNETTKAYIGTVQASYNGKSGTGNSATGVLVEYMFTPTSTTQVSLRIVNVTDGTLLQLGAVGSYPRFEIQTITGVLPNMESLQVQVDSLKNVLDQVILSSSAVLGIS